MFAFILGFAAGIAAAVYYPKFIVAITKSIG